MKAFNKILLIALAIIAMCPAPAAARKFNDRLQNRPYADNRRWHLGFSVGVFSSSLSFTHNGLVTDDGRAWVAEQPDYSPGFCVNGLFDLRLSNYFSVRFSPGMYFGNRDIRFFDPSTNKTEKQNIKSAYIVTPLDVKFAGVRYRNSRPYLVAGVMPAIDVGKKRNDDFLKLKPADVYLTVGFGCDFYLPYFKFIPEIKFCFGLGDMINHKRPELADEPQKFDITRSLTKATSKMIVLTFYFE